MQKKIIIKGVQRWFILYSTYATPQFDVRVLDQRYTDHISVYRIRKPLHCERTHNLAAFLL